MALNDYQENEYLPIPLRVWLKTPNKVITYRPFDYLRMFKGEELQAVLNNKFASDLASGYTPANISNLMSGIAPRMQQILVNKIVNKVDYIGYEKCEKLSSFISKEYLTIKLKKSFNNAVRTGRDLLVVYPDVESKKVKIRNIDLFRHKVLFDDEKISEAYILVDKVDKKANESFLIFEHRFYDNENKACQEFTLEAYKWNYDGNLEKTDRNNISKDQIDSVIRSVEPMIQEKLAQYKFYKKVELGLNDLGCYHIDNTLYNSKIPNSKIPESRFVNIQDKIMEIENSITFKEMDKNLGRGRAVIPNQFKIASSLGARGNTSNLAGLGAFDNPMDKTYFVKYQAGEMSNATPQAMQFDIRAEAWRTSLNGEIGDLCAAFGISILDYDPRLLQSGQRTDDEINAMTDITASTVEELRSMNELQINTMLDTIAKFVGEETPIAIKWNIASIINPTKNQTLIGMQLQNGTISRREAIKRSNPDYTEDEIDEELARIQEERGLAEANAIF
jgi:hypothetical protein